VDSRHGCLSSGKSNPSVQQTGSGAPLYKGTADVFVQGSGPVDELEGKHQFEPSPQTSKGNIHPFIDEETKGQRHELKRGRTRTQARFILNPVIFLELTKGIIPTHFLTHQILQISEI
jgi:hypothetical protein